MTLGYHCIQTLWIVLATKDHCQTLSILRYRCERKDSANKDFRSPTSPLKTIYWLLKILMVFLCREQVTQLDLLRRGAGCRCFGAACCVSMRDITRQLQTKPSYIPKVKYLVAFLHAWQVCQAQGAVSRAGLAKTTVPSTERDTVVTQSIMLWPFIFILHLARSLSCNKFKRQMDRETKTCSLPQ